MTPDLPEGLSPGKNVVQIRAFCIVYNSLLLTFYRVGNGYYHFLSPKFLFQHDPV